MKCWEQQSTVYWVYFCASLVCCCRRGSLACLWWWAELSSRQLSDCWRWRRRWLAHGSVWCVWSFESTLNQLDRPHWRDVTHWPWSLAGCEWRNRLLLGVRSWRRRWITSLRAAARSETDRRTAWDTGLDGLLNDCEFLSFRPTARTNRSVCRTACVSVCVCVCECGLMNVVHKSCNCLGTIYGPLVHLELTACPISAPLWPASGGASG